MYINDHNCNQYLSSCILGTRIQGLQQRANPYFLVNGINNGQMSVEADRAGPGGFIFRQWFNIVIVNGRSRVTSGPAAGFLDLVNNCSTSASSMVTWLPLLFWPIFKSGSPTGVNRCINIGFRYARSVDFIQMCSSQHWRINNGPLTSTHVDTT